MTRTFSRRAGPPYVIIEGCIECGICSYVCPSNIPLSQLFAASKSRVRKLKVVVVSPMTAAPWSQQARADRRFDPADRHVEARLDEYAVRFTPWRDSRLNLQVGKFATVVGSWALRHGWRCASIRTSNCADRG